MKRFFRLATTVTSIAGLVGLVACGGNTPAKNPDPNASSSATTTKSSEPPPATTPTTAGSGPKIEGPAAPTNSDDVKKGIAALKAGDLNGARASFEVAIGKNPKQADAHHYMGLVLEQQGDKPGAEKSYRRALEIQPDLEEAATNLA